MSYRNQIKKKNMKSPIVRKTMAKIEEEKLRPKSAWGFRLKSISLWILVVVGLLIVVLGSGIMLEVFDKQPIVPFFFSKFSIVLIILSTISWFWIATLIFSIGVIVISLKKTKKGYRYSVVFIAISILLLSTGIGYATFKSGVAKLADDTFAHVPMYRGMMEHRDSAWMNPEDGFLSGKVVEIRSQNNFSCMDLYGVLWQIDATEAYFGRNRDIEMQDKVVIFGDIISDGKFKAIKVHIRRNDFK